MKKRILAFFLCAAMTVSVVQVPTVYATEAEQVESTEEQPAEIDQVESTEEQPAEIDQVESTEEQPAEIDQVESTEEQPAEIEQVESTEEQPAEIEQVESTEEQPAEIEQVESAEIESEMLDDTVPECDCGNSKKAVKSHSDACALKLYYQNICGQTAEEIYAQWEEYPKDAQEYILLYLIWNSPNKYKELKGLILGEGGEPGEEPDDKADAFVEFDGACGDMAVGVYASEGAFPEGTTMSVTETAIENNVAESAVDALSIENTDLTVLGSYAADISFYADGEKQQPSESVILDLSVPADSLPAGTNMIAALHIGENGAEILGYEYIETDASDYSVVVRTDHFSSYAAVYVDASYNARLMSEELKENQTYSIETFDVNLFDYDGTKFNTAIDKIYGNGAKGKGFYFRGAGVSSWEYGTEGINDSGQYAKQGIVKDELVDGLPSINFVGNKTDADCSNMGKYLFSTTQPIDGKTVYKDQKFEFIYNKNTGYYEYKSAANHAQYNESEKLIQLYADTLSPTNNKTGSLKLADCVYTETGTNNEKINGNAVSSVNSTSEGIKVTTTAQTAESRLDPYLTWGRTNQLLNLNASDIDQIYIKAKIPEDVKSNIFEVFFATSYTTDNSTNPASVSPVFKAGQSFRVSYTPTGEWMEIVIDTDDNAAWKKTVAEGESPTVIYGLRIDPFDSQPDNTEAQSVDVTKSYELEIAEISFLKDKDEHYTRGGFYPFSNITASFPGNGGDFTYDEWAKLHESSDITAVASRSVLNKESSNSMPNDQMHFAMSMDFDFYMPVSRTSTGRENDTNTTADNIRFEFTGDDDLWVFVDGKLALDIGGGHGATYGYIDFTDQTSYVQKAVEVTDYNTHTGDGTSSATDELAAALCTPGKHRVQIFYMERCGTVSNCFIKFNLPQTPQAAVTVGKEVAETNGAAEPLYDQEFQFQIEVKDSTGSVVKQKNESGTEMGWDYQLMGRGIDGSVEKSTFVDGKFSLKHGQYAMFDIPENMTVTVTETDGYNIAKYEYVSTKVNDVAARYGSGKTVAEGQLVFSFVNTYTQKLAELKIIKETADHKNPDQDFLFEITGPDEAVMKVIIPMEQFADGKGEVTIKDLAIGSYTVKELTSWSWRYTLTGASAEVDQKEQYNSSIGSLDFALTYQNETVTFTNGRTEEKWLDGSSWCQNLFNTENQVNGSAVENEIYGEGDRI